MDTNICLLQRSWVQPTIPYKMCELYCGNLQPSSETAFLYANLKNMGKFYKTYRIRKVTHCVSNYLEATNG